jgi:hypothetical protein
MKIHTLVDGSSVNNLYIEYGVKIIQPAAARPIMNIMGLDDFLSCMFQIE